MKDVLSYLEDREAEFERHLSVVRMLNARVDSQAGTDEIQIDIEHVNTIKSG